MSEKENKNITGFDLKKLSDNYYQAMATNLAMDNERISQLSGHLFALASANIGLLFVTIEFVQIEVRKIIIFPLSYWFTISFVGSFLSIILGLLSLKVEHSVLLKISREHYALQQKVIALMEKTKSTVAKTLEADYFMSKKPLQSMDLVNKTRWLQIAFLIISAIATLLISLSVINPDKNGIKPKRNTPNIHKYKSF